MSPELEDWWNRARRSLESSELLLGSDPDGAASRAYYAAFYAVSGLFSTEGRSFRKHSAVRTAVHHDLVKSGRWSMDLGKTYNDLVDLRVTGDYGVALHVTAEEAAEAVAGARRILEAVRRDSPENLPPID